MTLREISGDLMSLRSSCIKRLLEKEGFSLSLTCYICIIFADVT